MSLERRNLMTKIIVVCIASSLIGIVIGGTLAFAVILAYEIMSTL